MIQNRLMQLRAIMAEKEIDIYVVKTSDFHQSEYTGVYFDEREFMSGFTGSAGTLVVTKTKSALFTDGRYFIQADQQLRGTEIELMKSGVAGTPTILKYIDENVSENGCVAFDGRTIEAVWGLELEKMLHKTDQGSICKNASILYDKDYIDIIWTTRPPLSKEPAFQLEVKYAGEPVKDKLRRLRSEMSQKNADTHLIATLDDVCWLFNIRGNDVQYNPVVLAFAVITMQDVSLFTDEDKFSQKIKDTLASDDIMIKPYEDVYSYIEKIGKASLLIDTERMNYSLYKKIPVTAKIVVAVNPTVLLKATKNNIEVQNLKAAHVKDGVAVTKFLYWLKENIKTNQNITEISAADYLEKCRRQQEGFIELSFHTISAYNSNAAMMHYSATAESNTVLKPEGMLLVDSGGQYYEGTTDITRTIALGPVTPQMKKDFTLTLKGMLNLASAKFLYGCSGMNLDILARGPLWNEGIDYRCGTGHGVGYLLNVHEAPNGFRWKRVPERNDFCVLEEGMVTSNEPGVYIEGSYGIRIENEIVCKKSLNNEYGQFMEFEMLTVAPIDLDLVDLAYFSKIDIERLNQYHQFVFHTLSPYLDDKEMLWLKKYTDAV